MPLRRSNNNSPRQTKRWKKRIDNYISFENFMIRWHQNHPSKQQQQHSRRVSGENTHSGNNVPDSRSHPHAPPIQGFMIQKEAQERARQRALEANQHRQPVLGNQRPSNPYSTPRSSGSQGSGSGGIRDLSSSSGYAFSGAVGDHGKRRRAMSPSQAFTMQPPGSYSVARGPSNYFQQPPAGYSSGRHWRNFLPSKTCFLFRFPYVMVVRKYNCRETLRTIPFFVCMGGWLFDTHVGQAMIALCRDIGERLLMGFQPQEYQFKKSNSVCMVLVLLQFRLICLCLCMFSWEAAFLVSLLIERTNHPHWGVMILLRWSFLPREHCCSWWWASLERNQSDPIRLES